MGKALISSGSYDFIDLIYSGVIEILSMPNLESSSCQPPGRWQGPIESF